MGGGLGTQGENKNACRVLRPLGGPKRRWGHNISRDLQEMRNGVKSFHLGHKRDKWRVLVNTEINLMLFTPCIYLHSTYQPTDALSNTQIVKRNSWQVSNSFTFRHSGVPKREAVWVVFYCILLSVSVGWYSDGNKASGSTQYGNFLTSWEPTGSSGGILFQGVSWLLGLLV